MVKLKCHNKECGNVWDYKGKKLKATCSSCGLKVDIRTCKVK